MGIFGNRENNKRENGVKLTTKREVQVELTPEYTSNPITNLCIEMMVKNPYDYFAKKVGEDRILITIKDSNGSAVTEPIMVDWKTFQRNFDPKL